MLQLFPILTVGNVAPSLLNDYSLKTLLTSANIIKLLSAVLIYLSLSLFCKKTISPFFIIAFLILTLIFLFAYKGYFWHYLFYYVFFICAVWFNSENIFTDNFAKRLNVVTLILVSVFLIFWTPNRQSMNKVYENRYQLFINNFINEDALLSKSKILFDDLRIQPIESLKKGRYINYCFAQVRVLPVPYLKSDFCDKYNSDIKFDYTRMDYLYTKDSYFLTSKKFNNIFVFINNNNQNEYFLLRHYKTYRINDDEYNFYKIEKRE